MRKVGFIILFNYFTLFAQANQLIVPDEHETSPTAVVVVGAILLIIIVVVLFSRQKRRFND